MDKKIVIIFFTIVLVVAVVLYGDTKGWFTTYEDYMDDNNLRKGYELAGILDFVDELGYLKEDSEILVEHRAKVDEIFGETWHSNNYNKDEIAVPEVEAEETIEGELWFPAINNTAPLDEIAPTISYELMLDGYKISPYYPQNPEKYTAQALNENAFPIGFFRKVNDLCYYTACKVEGGGYIYYFFCANGGITPEDALDAAGEEMKFNSEGKMVMDNPIHLYNTELADLDSIDITKEAVWRGSVYVAQELGTCDEFTDKINEKINSGNWYECTANSLSDEVSENFKPIAELQDIWADNACEYDKATKEFEYYLLQEVNNQGGLLYSYHMCSDGYVILEHSVQKYGNGVTEYKPVNNISPAEILQVTGTVGYNKSFMALVGHRIGIAGAGLSDYMQEYNTYSIEILPQDNIHNLK